MLPDSHSHFDIFNCWLNFGSRFLLISHQYCFLTIFSQFDWFIILDTHLGIGITWCSHVKLLVSNGTVDCPSFPPFICLLSIISIISIPSVHHTAPSISCVHYFHPPTHSTTSAVWDRDTVGPGVSHWLPHRSFALDFGSLIFSAISIPVPTVPVSCYSFTCSILSHVALWNEHMRWLFSLWLVLIIKFLLL